MKLLKTKDIRVWTECQLDIDVNYKLNSFAKPRKSHLQSVEYVAELFEQLDGKKIVECGSGVHTPDCSALKWFEKTNATEIHYIDLDPVRIEEVKERIGTHERVHYHIQSCLDVVPKITDIDLLYMDFWVGRGADRAKAYYDLYNLANRPRMILIDDSDHTSPWKHTAMIPVAIADGYTVEYVGRQTLLLL
tara:strand:- start:367 stop:939 length:573 start_codon:yes stop_codon:yes gene_type:complete